MASGPATRRGVCMPAPDRGPVQPVEQRPEPLAGRDAQAIVGALYAPHHARMSSRASSALNSPIRSCST